VYHNADPIPQGACTGIISACTYAGYALETRCHLGKSIVYDTVRKFSWRVDIRHHVIKEVITRVVEEEGEWEDGREVPIARVEDDCIVSTPAADHLAALLKKKITGLL
jgi:lipase ATG15